MSGVCDMYMAFTHFCFKKNVMFIVISIDFLKEIRGKSYKLKK